MRDEDDWKGIRLAYRCKLCGAILPPWIRKNILCRYCHEKEMNRNVRRRHARPSVQVP